MDLTFEETSRLVAQAQEGHDEAVELLFERYIPRVRQMVALRLGRRLSDLGAVEDLVQETLVDAFRGLERFEQRSVGSFRSWLAKLAVNRIRDEARRRTALKRGAGNVRNFADFGSSVLTESVLIGLTVQPADVAAGSELAERVEAALLALGERDRRVIELRRIAELSFYEIAGELKLGSANAARAQFSRSLRRLAQQIEGPDAKSKA